MKLSREEIAKEFKKEYEILCDKYQMEIGLIDRWDDGNYDMEIYDRESGLYILDVFHE